MRSQAMTHVLIFDDRVLNDEMRQMLTGSGFHLVDVPDVATGVQLLRDSAESMAVLFWVSLAGLTMSGLDQVALLGELLHDQRLAQRHTFVLVTPTPVDVRLALGNLMERIQVIALAVPLDRERLLAALWLATQRIDGLAREHEFSDASLI